MAGENPDKAEQKAAAQAKYSDWMSKTWLLMEKMSAYHPNCSIKFLYQPNRLDLKFERSFAMAVKKSRSEVIARFPKRTIKTGRASPLERSARSPKFRFCLQETTSGRVVLFVGFGAAADECRYG